MLNFKNRSFSLVAMGLMASCGLNPGNSSSPPALTPEEVKQKDIESLNEKYSPTKILSNLPEVEKGLKEQKEASEKEDSQKQTLGLDQFSLGDQEKADPLAGLSGTEAAVSIPEGSYIPSSSPNTPKGGDDFELVSLNCDINYVAVGLMEESSGMTWKQSDLSSLNADSEIAEFREKFSPKNDQKSSDVPNENICKFVVTTALFKNHIEQVSEVKLPLVSDKDYTYRARSLCFGDIKGNCLSTEISGFSLSKEAALSRKVSGSLLNFKNIPEGAFLIVEFEPISGEVVPWVSHAAGIAHPGENKFVSQFVNKNLYKYLNEKKSAAKMADFVSNFPFSDCDMVALAELQFNRKGNQRLKATSVLELRGVRGNMPEFNRIIHTELSNHAWNFKINSNEKILSFSDHTPAKSLRAELYFGPELVNASYFSPSQKFDIYSYEENKSPLDKDEQEFRKRIQKEKEEFLSQIQVGQTLTDLNKELLKNSPVGDLNEKSLRELYNLDGVKYGGAPVAGDLKGIPESGLGSRDQLYLTDNYFIGNLPSKASNRSMVGAKWILTKKTPSLGIKGFYKDREYSTKLYIGGTYDRPSLGIPGYTRVTIQVGEKTFVSGSHHSPAYVSLVGLTETTPVLLFWDSYGEGKYYQPPGSFTGTLLDYFNKVYPGDFKWIEALEGMAFIQTK